MQHRNQQQESHLSEIIRLLSTYRALSLFQLEALYPELTRQKLLLLLKKLEKTGRLTLMSERNLVLYKGDCVPDPSTLAAFWVLLDFREDITYHTASDFPVTLTFYTQSDAYGIIHIPEEKEILMNHALSVYKEDSPRRIAVVDNAGQIPILDFPGITAFCTVTPDGKVQYYRKQGVTDT
ncbi:MAG: hypothetical protein K1W41_01360 [Lachnospiraceae bacterium]